MKQCSRRVSFEAYAHVLNLCHFPQRPACFKVPTLLLHSFSALLAVALCKVLWSIVEDWGDSMGCLHPAEPAFLRQYSPLEALASDRKWHLHTAAASLNPPLSSSRSGQRHLYIAEKCQVAILKGNPAVNCWLYNLDNAILRDKKLQHWQGPRPVPPSPLPWPPDRRHYLHSWAGGDMPTLGNDWSLRRWGGGSQACCCSTISNYSHHPVLLSSTWGGRETWREQAFGRSSEHVSVRTFWILSILVCKLIAINISPCSVSILSGVGIPARKDDYFIS